MLPDRGGKVMLLKTSNDMIFPRQISVRRQLKAKEREGEKKWRIELGDEEEAEGVDGVTS